MGLFDRLTGEFVDIIEWLDDSRDTIVWRYQRHDNAIKYGAKLIVRESQVALFINEGQLADIFTPGTYELNTQNMPMMTTINNWRHGFSSPFKAEVYFVNTKLFIDRKWGTGNPIMMRDSEFGVVRLRSYGTYAIRVTEPAQFIKEIVGTDGRFTAKEVTDQLRNIIIARFTDAVAESQIPVLDMAANQNEFAKIIYMQIRPEFKALGLELEQFLIENISLPPKVEEMLDKRTSMGVIGDLYQYTQFQTANAIEDAAKNPGGGAGEGLGMGMGFAMANQMANKQNPQLQGGTNTPPPLPQADQYFLGLEGKSKGPFSMAQIKEAIQSGKLQKDTLVWKQGMPEWTAAQELTAIANLFPAAPPPLPPQG